MDMISNVISMAYVSFLKQTINFPTKGCKEIAPLNKIRSVHSINFLTERYISR